VKAYMKEFSKPQYGVDVLKLEVPINMKFVEGTKSFKGQTAYTREEAKNHFRESAKCTNLPFIYLSAGVSNAEFAETLDLVAESGVKYNGVLCGRARRLKSGSTSKALRIFRTSTRASNTPVPGTAFTE
jgi:tagatose 1,6-diphosphate aldolase